MKTVRRWMKSVLAESAKPAVALPWQRGKTPGAKALPAASATAGAQHGHGTPARACA